MALTTSTMSASVKSMYEKRLLLRGLPRLLHGRWAKHATINGFGDYELRRYESMSAVTSPLSEGSTPGQQTAPTITSVTLDPVYYGAYVIVTDVLEMEAFDPVISETSAILGEQCGLSIDTIIRNALVSGATAAYPSDVSAVGSLDAPAHNISYKDIVKQSFALQAANALPADGGRFPVVMHPHSLATLFNDETFVNAFIMGTQEELKSGKMGTVLNCDLYCSSNAYELADGGAGSTTDVYEAFFIAQEGFGTVGMASVDPKNVDMMGTGDYNMTGKPVKPVEIIVKPTDSGGADNPLNQRGSIAWKASNDVEITNSSWIIGFYHTTIYSDD